MADHNVAAVAFGHITLTRCWECMLGSHHDFDHPIRHTWMDIDDIDHARATGQDVPADLVKDRPCACECGGGPGAHIALQGAP